jgi:hypothetical protein
MRELIVGRFDSVGEDVCLPHTDGLVDPRRDQPPSKEARRLFAFCILYKMTK